MQVSSVTDPMAQRKEDHVAPAAEEQQRAGPEGDSNEDKDTVLLQSVSHGAAAYLAPAEVGIIESVQLENFMCHANLGPLKFGSNVNFVVGYWGKSALLSALVIGLGGKLLGSPLREFVKDGEVAANISITLANRGEDAFKSDLYGDSITVQRCIRISGSASYKLTGQAGNLVSSQKSELKAILNHFKIRVDNPMSVLTQDMGRQLLFTQHDGERYKFFLKVTGLQKKREEYLYLLERKARTHCQIEQGEKQLQELKLKGIDIEQCFHTMVASRKRLEDLKQEKAWALVSESERQIKQMIRNINIADQHTITLNQKLEGSQVRLNEAVRKFKDIQEKLQQLNKEASALETECAQAKENVNEKGKACKRAELLYNASQSELKGLDKAKLNSDQIEDLKKTVEQEKSEKEEKIVMLKEKIKTFKDQEESLVREMGQLRRDIKKHYKERSRLKHEVISTRHILHNEQRELNQLLDYKADPVKRYDPPLSSLVAAVDIAHREGRFSRKPIGPLGVYIRLRDPDYALAVEACLKGLLFAFCCNSHKDEKVLSKLMKRFYPPNSPRPQIIVKAFNCEVYNVADRAVFHPEFPTVLTALEIREAVVANALIDERGIESVLLIKNSAVARKVMQIQKPPKNCVEAFTADGDQVFERCYHSCDKLKPTYLVDIEMELNHMEQKIENTVEQLSLYHKHTCALENDIKKDQETINNHNLHLKEIKISVIQITMQIRDLENEEKQLVDISVLEKEAQEIKKQMKEVEEKIKIRKEDMENLRKQKIDAEQRHKNLKIKMCEVSELTESVHQELNQADLEMHAEKQYMLHYQTRLQHHMDSLQLKKEQLTMKEKDLDKEIAQAKYICPERKQVKKTTTIYDREIGLLKQRIRSESSLHRSREEIVRMYQQVKEKYQDIDVQVKNLKRCIKPLGETAMEKYETYQQFVRSVALQCKLYFDDLLSQWHYSGEMSFDHENETLSIRVQPKKGNKGVFDEMQSWSENSFSNFFFIVSLWSITESPFRCLDAIDTFLDPASRKIAMDIIVKIAHSKQNQQLILLTPQNMNIFSGSPLTRILQLPDSENHQKTLFFRLTQEEEK